MEETHANDTEETIVYSCSACNIGFESKYAIKMHMKDVHKQFSDGFNECSVCSVVFVDLNDLEEHLSDEHDIIDKICEICKEPFNSKMVFDSHMVEHEIRVVGEFPGMI